MLNNIINEFNEEINKIIKYNINFLSKININKFSLNIFDNLFIKYNNINYKLSEISKFKYNNDYIIIEPVDKIFLNTIYKYLQDNNIIEYKISKLNNKELKIENILITTEKRKKLLVIIDKELEKTKINIRNIRKNINNKIKLLVKNKISKDEIKKSINYIDKLVIKYINDINNLYIKKKEKLCNL